MAKGIMIEENDGGMFMSMYSWVAIIYQAESDKKFLRDKLNGDQNC